jgi:nitroreductase
MESQEATTCRTLGMEELLERRFSPRDFSSRPVEAEKLRKLFEAARSAPSSFNEQPWRFVVATREDAEGFARLLETLVEQNGAWAQHAPVLMLSIAKLEFTHNGRRKRHALYDVGQAAAYLTLQATAQGLCVHQTAGFDVEKARQLLKIPDGYEPAAMMAVGYLGDAEPVSEPPGQHDGPGRGRKPLDSLAFEGMWGKPWPLAADGESKKNGQ